MSKDIWHFSRSELAQQVLGLFETALSAALVFFAPRRMGKTEFLRKDIQTLAEKKNWKTFYFSFLDTGEKVQEEFTYALADFAKTIGVLSDNQRIFSRVRKIGAQAVGMSAHLELNELKDLPLNMKIIFSAIAQQEKVILLMDEVQVLAKSNANQQFVAGLRTSLDMYKDSIKVIFTGSSREGLRQMFSQANAPFFHFGQNLPFPELNRDFTNHLCHVFNKVTGRRLDQKVLWEIFQQMDRVPQLIRSLVERLALNPTLTLLKAKELLFADLFDDRAYLEIWAHLSKLEQILLQEIANRVERIFAENTRCYLAKRLGVSALSVPAIQSAIRVLQRKNLIGRLPERAGYFIDDPNFKTWLQDREG